MEVPPHLGPRSFRFTGTGAEYFRIWIVNLLLSVVTLGIYSAWAKVRRLRYFYGHTSVDGSAFGYHAPPIAILKGRLIAYAVIALLAILSEFAPLLASVVYFPLLMVMPIILVRAFRFRAANSSYRGIRFGFDGLESEAYAVFLFLPLLVPFTLGLAYPYVAKRQREFFVGESRHGRSQFGLELPTGQVYRIYLVAGIAIAAMLGVGLVVAFGAAMGDTSRAGDEITPGPRFLAAVALLYAGIGATVVAVRTAFENLVWNHTRLDVHRFESRLRARDMVWLYASNIVLIVVTLGLAVPWARVRMAHYRARSLTLLPGGPLETSAMDGQDGDSATGAELSDAMDFDFGL
ncbi:MAG: YjgN family protein [Vicinamibacterales bacterium]